MVRPFCRRCFMLCLKQDWKGVKQRDINVFNERQLTPSFQSSQRLFSSNYTKNLILKERKLHRMPELATVLYRMLSSSRFMQAKFGVSGSPVLNPIEHLQKFVAAPLLSEKEKVFQPTEEEILQGHRLFVPSKDHKIKFLKSALFDQHLPQYEIPEVAFIGRSNVGKSSLIRLLLADAEEEVRVRCSKTPGHTKLLNFFQVGECLSLVDMPGYGHRMPEHYTQSVEMFLRTRKKLARVLMLIDSSVGVTQTDVIGFNMLEEFNVPYIVVLTKIDKAKPAVLIQNLKKVKSYMHKLPHCTPQPFLVSSIKGDGVAMLQAFIAYVTGNLAVQGVGVVKQ